MKTIKVTPGRYKVLQSLTRKDIGLLKKHPKILAESRQLLRACKKVIKRLESISEYASRRKRQTAYKRIAAICQKAIDRVEK
jgi:5-bromo-4-chloroindolyl phosphate hydrolysis protein